jgi:hypothetical protein
MKKKGFWLRILVLTFGIMLVGIVFTGCNKEDEPGCYQNHKCFFTPDTPNLEGSIGLGCGNVDCDAERAMRETRAGNKRNGYCSCPY